MTERSRFIRLIVLAVLLLFAAAVASQLALAAETTAEVQVSAFGMRQ
jgi:flagellar basal body-associated protein FliL